MMKNLLGLFVAICFILPGLMGQNFPAQPNPPRLVNDFAGVLSPAERQSLEDKLVAYDDSTSTQIAIVTIETLDGAEVGSYAAELGERWGIGSKENHNGILILMATQERKVTIRTGYGVEEKLGAIRAKRIIDNILTPNFKRGDFYIGFDRATSQIIAFLSGMYVNEEEGDEGIPVWMIILFIIVIFFIFPFIFRQGNKSTTYGRSGPNTWGGGWGGGFGGSSRGGGGFGGFGGGSFSGGGASGSW